MQTNDFIRELEKIHPHFTETDIEKDLWNGFVCNSDGLFQYEKHLNSLFLQYFNEINDHIDNLLLNKTANEIKLFITNKTNKFETLKSPLLELDNDDEFLKIRYEDLARLESIECDENSPIYQQYKKKGIIRIKHSIEKHQLISDFLTYKIDRAKLHDGIEKWKKHIDTSDEADEEGFVDGWDKERIETYYFQLIMERMGREYINKSLKELNDKYSYFIHTQQISQEQSYIGQQYTFDTKKISTIYDFCIGTKVFGCHISEFDFICSITMANFKPIYVSAEDTGGKTKCKYLIYFLSAFVIKDVKWYTDTAHSIDTEPTKCSGVNVPANWKKAIKGLKI